MKILKIFCLIFVVTTIVAVAQSIKVARQGDRIVELERIITEKDREIASLRKELEARKSSTKSVGKATVPSAEKEGQQTLAEKNNNPLNVKVWKKNCNNYWRGQRGTDEFGHAIFESEEHGVRAAALTLRSYAKEHKIDTLEGIVERFCTANKARKAKYVAFLSKRLNLGPKEKFNLIPRMSELLAAMGRFESGKEIDPKILGAYDILAKI